MGDNTSPRAGMMLSLIAGVSILAATIALMPSLLTGLLIAIITLGIVLSLVHNYAKFGSRLREKNDRIMIESCESGLVGRFRKVYRHLPASPRCRICLVPFGGVGRMLRIKPSRKNSNFCTSCIDSSPEGVHDMEVGVLFADIRGFTAWSSSQPTSAAAKRVSQFYDLANRALMRDDALIEFVGDQVMALYLPDFPSLRHHTADTMLSAARRLMSEVQAMGSPDTLHIGIGIHFGLASVGNIRKGGQKDFTAIGDVVNTASRLQSSAGPSEIIISEGVYEKLTTKLENAERRSLKVKGKSTALPVYVIPCPTS